MQISQHATSMPPADRAGAGPLKSLSSDLLELLESGQAFSDVTFSVEGRHVSAHRCVLAARSPFFRTIFSGAAPQLQQQTGQPRTSASAAAAAAGPQVIPVGIVGYDVFKLLLQFLYSGDISFSAKHGARGCKDKTCWHTHCSSAVEFGLETLNAAHFFGVGELSVLTQKHLASMAQQASIDDVMRILVAARKQDGQHLWNVCSELVGKSGLPTEILQKHLPPDVVTEIESLRQKTDYGYGSFTNIHAAPDQKAEMRMQKALDSSDVELVKMMVMGEGLNLDKVFALHYAVSNCSRKVVKTLLDLGAADVNLRGSDGLVPLHLASRLGDPEKIAMLLDNRADPHIHTPTGATAMDIVQSLATKILTSGGYNTKGDHNRLRLCLELLERALAATPPRHFTSMKLESGSPPSILTGHGSSILMPDESDNFQASLSRSAIGGSSAGLLGNIDLYPNLSQGYLHGKVLDRGSEKGESRDSMSKLLRPIVAAAAFGSNSQHHGQAAAESRSLTSDYSLFESSSLGESPSKMPRLFTDFKDLPVLREAVLKDITSETMDSFKSILNPIPSFVDEEVNSGWQLFLQEHAEALSEGTARGSDHQSRDGLPTTRDAGSLISQQKCLVLR